MRILERGLVGPEADPADGTVEALGTGSVAKLEAVDAWLESQELEAAGGIGDGRRTVIERIAVRARIEMDSHSRLRRTVRVEQHSAVGSFSGVEVDQVAVGSLLREQHEPATSIGSRDFHGGGGGGQ